MNFSNGMSEPRDRYFLLNYEGNKLFSQGVAKRKASSNLLTKWEMDFLEKFIKPKTFNKISYVANVLWVVIGSILIGIFVDIDVNESSDFICDAQSHKQDLIRGKCFEQYQERDKFAIPVYAFVLINFIVIAVVFVTYSQVIESIVDRLSRPGADHVSNKHQQGNPGTRPRKLFIAYCLQLTIRLLLGISLIILQTQVLYPSKFPSNFKCNLARQPDNTVPLHKHNMTQTQTQTYDCHNQRATKKTFWVDAVAVVNATFAVFVFLEIVWILSRARNRNEFTEDAQFFADHLSQPPLQPRLDNTDAPENPEKKALKKKRPQYEPTPQQMSSEPFRLRWLEGSRITTCYGCQNKFRPSMRDPPPLEPFDVVLSRKQTKMYGRKNEVGKNFTKNPEDVFYHVHRGCLQLKNPDHDTNSIRLVLSDDDKQKLKTSHKLMFQKEFKELNMEELCST